MTPQPASRAMPKILKKKMGKLLLQGLLGTFMLGSRGLVLTL